MRLEKVDSFLKTKDCPPSEDLLSLTLAACLIESTSEIISHLDVCDFCAAEAHFLSKFQATELSCSINDIPPDLRLLAESLLQKRSPDSELSC
jgi:coenzyme F420-reducing hydrogenase gamma subunit